MDLREIGWEGVDRILLLQDAEQWQALVMILWIIITDYILALQKLIFVADVYS
jgi:hypothetical protein